MFFRGAAAAVMLVALSATASAQQSVELEFSAGQVTLIARDAPVRAVLAEWARLGGATIVNGERVAGPPVTLELSGVSERQALDVLLRGVAGYMLAPRPVGEAGASAFNRILILPTSVGPRNPPPAPAAAARQRPVMPQRPVIVGPDGLPLDMNGLPADMNDGFPEDPAMMGLPGTDQTPVQGIPRIAQPRLVMPPQPFGVEPQIVTFDGTEEQQAEPPDQGVAPTPANPFGVPFGSSAVPGVVVPAPQPADDVQ